ncbi:ABC transporter ATP-binding protein [Enterococcus faecium]|uniref:ABC transporter domain-containing protein n=2 Tax=Enterococcus TaxID=1350 RepID=A0AB37I6N0_ENTHR|nr:MULTISPECIES: ABC transporter ATP-binding protein [Enterococcus]EGP5140732.1 ABC transporter ATP-binding protein [Enterococcus faecium]EGP5620221.1 ABC transporter ATP-binding protein [Enterococcus faecium]EME3547222.1 ABC transporter ATP-binding protein [Enterococcus faecium]EME7175168.1 ABC transporter ATP-binding protein [Enterococcus faecium]EMF0486427.1 ABC transporter ATP-binding protein [Enterococcus hirae]
MNLIETKNLTKKYGQQIAVNQLNIKISAGQLTGYLGTNGAGKSTTIKMLTKTLTPSSGEIFYSNSKQSIAMGVVFQNSVLDNELTVFDNLFLRGQMYQTIEKETIISLMKKTGVFLFAEKKYGNLSGGMRRKVDITRALINQPDILFLDEPTTGLDPQSRKEIWGLLNELKQNGLGIFLTTHYLEEAEFADYIYILEKGNIVEEGSAYELKKKYGQPVIHLLSNQMDLLERELKNYHTKKKSEDSIDVYLENKKEVFSLLQRVKRLILDFSYQPIGMNEVFLKVTGKGIEHESIM